MCQQTPETGIKSKDNQQLVIIDLFIMSNGNPYGKVYNLL